MPVGSSTTRLCKPGRIAAPPDLLTNPRIGERLDEFEPREVRRIVVGHYEMRYEIQKSTIYVLRLWHTREDR
ncbi:MAG: type II toxin-antitoxin system RelE/ParE family toxin [Acidithiobacillus sp.]